MGRTYFTVITWYSMPEVTQVFEEETFLEQWELKFPTPLSIPLERIAQFTTNFDCNMRFPLV
ncbi:hypothetical protein [Mesobacillus foraminis]|uniref:hypothetical protein n=1 Tax=Mesobacillus foraminis TaxID=279826 RepID=UPI001046496A|nr:hypothetical protein [Mesobacillus foraminis]